MNLLRMQSFFMPLLARVGTVEKLPPDSFAEQHTSSRTGDSTNAATRPKAAEASRTRKNEAISPCGISWGGGSFVTFVASASCGGGYFATFVTSISSAGGWFAVSVADAVISRSRYLRASSESAGNLARCSARSRGVLERVDRIHVLIALDCLYSKETQWWAHAGSLHIVFFANAVTVSVPRLALACRVATCCSHGAVPPCG